jgi:spore germination protein KC
MKKKIILFIVILVTSLSTTGCFDYKDINRTVFITSIMVDIDSLKNPILYAETFIAARGAQLEVGAESKTIFTAREESLFDAARSLSLSTNYTLDYSQCRAVIFSTRAANYGLDNFLDLFERGQELPVRSYVFISPLEPEKLLNIRMEEEQYLGIFLSELVKNTKLSSKGTVVRIDEFFNRRLLGSKVNLVNVIDLKKEQQNPRLSLIGLAAIKDDKMVSKLNLQEGMAYNFLNNTFEQGVINADNPEHIDKITSLEILKSKTKTEIKFDGNKIQLKKKIDARASFGFTEKSVHIRDSKERSLIEESGAENIKKMCEKLFAEYKEKNIDIFNVQREFEMKYPKLKIENCLQLTDLQLEATVNIKGSTNATDFK